MNPRITSRAVLVAALLMGSPAASHEVLSEAAIEAAVERALHRRDLQQRNFALCERLSEQLVTELRECSRQQKKSTRCTDHSITDDLLAVGARPECAAYNKSQERCQRHFPSDGSDLFAAHTFTACLSDPFGWIRAPR